MKTNCLLLTGATAVLLTACLPSVHPFYTSKDIVSDARIVGEWAGEEDEEPAGWKFEADPDGTYRLTVTDDEGRQGRFTATLFRLREDCFLDLFPEDCDYATNQADLVAVSMIPGHLLVHLAQLEPTLRMAFCDPDWLGGYLEAHPKALAHRRGDGIVLTDSTRRLQRFVLKHLESGDLFSDYSELARRDGGTAP